jgi:hypothetical protein
VPPPDEPRLLHLAWRRREIENYLCQEATLIAWAESEGVAQQGELFAAAWRPAMERAISEIATALHALKKPEPWSRDTKVTDDFLDPLFSRFFEILGLPNLMRKTDYHTLARFVAEADVDTETREKLDAILATAQRAHPA